MSGLYESVKKRAANKPSSGLHAIQVELVVCSKMISTNIRRHRAFSRVCNDDWEKAAVNELMIELACRSQHCLSKVAHLAALCHAAVAPTTVPEAPAPIYS